MSFFNELKRRNVFRVAAAYVVAAWVLLQVADLVLENIQAPGWVIQAFMLMVALGFVAAVVVAWAYELTPDGIKREAEVERGESVTHETSRKLDRIIIGFLALAVAYFIWESRFSKQGLEPSPAGPVTQSAGTDPKPAPLTPVQPSIAVLPFVNMSDDAGNEYFSDGLTETLLHMLAQLPQLRVAARTSSFAFKGKEANIAEIATALGVAYILEGSVQKANDRVRVTAQLIRADDGFHLWSQNYTRPLEDIFAIQDEIAADVASALDTSLLGRERALKGIGTSSLGAYDSYLKGLEEQSRFSYSSLPAAETYFKAALASDPGFMDARLALVRNHILSQQTGLIDEQSMRSASDPLLAQVRKQDPGNRFVRALELTMHLMGSGTTLGRDNMESIVGELRDLLAYLPTETFIRLRLAAVFQVFFQQPQTAAEILSAGLLIDPMDADLHGSLGGAYLEMGDLEGAGASFLRSLELQPGNPNTYDHLHRLELEYNRMAAGLEWLRRATEVDPNDHELAANIARYLYLLELPEEGDRWRARVQALAPGSGVARRVDLERAVARGDTALALETAAAMVADQVDQRQNAFATALFHYAAMMMDAGRSREAYDFLVGVRPEIADYDRLGSDFKGLLMQWVSVGLMSGFAEPPTRLKAWNRLTAGFNAMGFPWRNPRDPGVTWDLIMKGETKSAAAAYLEGPLGRPLATNLRNRWRNLKPLFRDVYAEPGVAARLEQMDREWDAMREEVREMLLQPEWQPAP